MKTTVKAIIATFAAIAVGFAVRNIFTEMGDQLVDADTPVQLVEDAMVTAKTMFMEKPDDIQLLTAELMDNQGLELLLGEDGLPHKTTGEVFTLPGERQAILDAVFSKFECGGRVRQLLVKDDAVLFYTDFPADGCTGFLYETEEGETAYYDYLELLENWKIFYRIPKLNSLPKS